MRRRWIIIGFFLVCVLLFCARAFSGNSNALNNLVKAAQDNNLQDLPGYIDAVGEAKEARAVDTLMQLLGNKNPVIRWKIYIALGKIDTDVARAAIASGIEHEDQLFWNTFRVAVVEGDSLATAGILIVGKPLLPQLQKIASDPTVKNKSFVNDLIQKVQAGR